MQLYSLLFLALSLSTDALGIGVSYKLRKIKISFIAKFTIYLISMAVMGASGFLGNLFLNYIPACISKFIGCFMLLVLGIWIIISGIRYPEKSRQTKDSFSYKFIKNPLDCDLDNSKHLDLRESLYLSVALSVDSFAVGVSASITGLNCIIVSVLTAAFQVAFLSIGEYIGSILIKLAAKNKKSYRLNHSFLVIVSGFILVILAVTRYFL